MDINYERLEWEDFPSTETPINADNLNHLEEGIAGLYAERYEMQSNIAYVEDGDTASKDYLPNSYLMRDGLFYKVTKTILYGDSFDSGEDGNIEHVDISSQFGSGGGGSTGCVELTQAQYDALSDEAKMLDVIYLITDSPDNYLDEVFGDFASVEYTDTASKAYAVGDYLVYDSKFYKVTSAISQGDTIVPDTNVVKTTVGEELDDLDAGKLPFYNITSVSDFYAKYNALGDLRSCSFYMDGATASSFTNGIITATTKGIMTKLGSVADMFCMVGDICMYTIRATIGSSSHTLGRIFSYSSVKGKVLYAPASTWGANSAGHVKLSTGLSSNCSILSVTPYLYATNNNHWVTIASISTAEIDIIWHNTSGAAQTMNANSWGAIISYIDNT